MKTVTAGAWLALALLATGPAAAEVQTVQVEGDTVQISDALPAEVLGTYLYEGKGEPIVQINADGSGVSQRHGMAPTPIHAWILVDDKGQPWREVGSEQRYRYLLVVRYGDGSPYDAPGSYGYLDITIRKDQGRAIALGERFRAL